MKRTFCLLCCLLLMAVFGVPARAESGCWYLYTYGAHDFEQTEMRLPTCTEAGYFLLECRICGHNELHMTDSAIGHDWQRVDNESFSPTCTQAGITTWVCDECSLKRTESVKELGGDVYELTTIEGNLNSTIRRINYRYDATPKRQYYNMSAVPENEITEENCQYKLQKDDWYVTGFCATW